MARESVKLKKSGPAIIKRGALVANGARVENDPWVLLEDDAPAPEGADIIVSLTRFKAEREALLARNAGRIGITIASSEAVEEIGADAQRFSLIMVQFPTFRDGRGFTTARLLRERYRYTGELRATGDVLEDQLFFMLRVGFDAFEIQASDPASAFQRASHTFSAAYQPSSDGLQPVWVQRARKIK